MGRAKGIEPSTFWATARRSNQLSYARHKKMLTKEQSTSGAFLDYASLREAGPTELRPP